MHLTTRSKTDARDVRFARALALFNATVGAALGGVASVQLSLRSRPTCRRRRCGANKSFEPDWLLAFRN